MKHYSYSFFPLDKITRYANKTTCSEQVRRVHRYSNRHVCEKEMCRKVQNQTQNGEHFYFFRFLKAKKIHDRQKYDKNKYFKYGSTYIVYRNLSL